VKKLVSLVIFSTMILLSNQKEASAGSRVIDYPQYQGRSIDACVMNMGCDQSSISYAANAYCRTVGYRYSGYWKTKTYPRRKKKPAWRLEYRRSGDAWVSNDSGHAFSRIDCFD
jgi:hypothetical protein